MGESLARAYLKAIGNLNYDIASNGEKWLIERVQPSLVFDVGANVGDYAAMVREAVPNATIHCFEIVPATADLCAARFSLDPLVLVRHFGLSDREGIVRVKHFPGFTEGSTAFDYQHPSEHEWIDCRVCRGDDYAAENDVDRVDFVKLDVEGSEYDTLLGMERLLSEQRVGVLQFEYGKVAVLSKRLLYDHVELLNEHGYIVGKLFPEHVEFRSYDVLRDEDFIGPNYVALPQDSELLPVLGHRAR